MNTYPAAYDVNVSFSLADVVGLPKVVNAHYEVLDEDGTAVVADTRLPLVSGEESEIVIKVPAAGNMLAAGVRRAYRRVVLNLETSSGWVALEQEYLIQVSQATLLIPGTNSFQTILKAELVALDIPNLPGWRDAPREERIAAMIQARENIGKMSYRYNFWADNWQKYVIPEFGVYSITLLSQDEYMQLPPAFRTACERAQVIEADDLLAGDLATEKRRAGITSETVGDATTMFTQVRPVRQLLCDRAMRELSRFVVKHTRLTRV
jgi:hypothetical protein